MVRKSIRIAVILCDVPLDSVKDQYGDYRDIFERWLRGALTTYPQVALRDSVDLVVDGFDLVDKRELPSIEQLRQGPGGYDVVMLTGSKHTAHELTPSFTPILIEYIREIASHKELQHLKIVGICFGHQVIALALGGRSERGGNGWEIGVYGSHLTSEGRKVFLDWVDSPEGVDKLYIQQMHRDHVSQPPSGFIVCLTTDKYPVQAMIKYHSNESTGTAKEGIAAIPHILTIQGHPEFSPEIVHRIVERRIEQGVFDEATGNEGGRRAWGKNRQGGEGLGRVGWAIWNFILAYAVGPGTIGRPKLQLVHPYHDVCATNLGVVAQSTDIHDLLAELGLNAFST